jgi:hypothetical protein
MAACKRYKRMANNPDLKPNPVRSTIYQIAVEGHLSSRWRDSFGGLTISLKDDGATLLTGPVVDQSALYGLLKKMRDLGLSLVSVNRVGTRSIEASSDIGSHQNDSNKE